MRDSDLVINTVHTINIHLSIVCAQSLLHNSNVDKETEPMELFWNAFE